MRLGEVSRPLSIMPRSWGWALYDQGREIVSFRVPREASGPRGRLRTKKRCSC